MAMSKVTPTNAGLDPTKVVECPICLDVIMPPIAQCEVGHSMCKKCFDESHLTVCPLCKRNVAAKRHVVFEQLLESIREKLIINCRYAYKGCKYDVAAKDKENHERDCKYRTFKCEGKSFANWDCDWVGEYDKLENHFKTAHKTKTFMEYNTEATQKVNFQTDSKDLQLISFFNGQAYFYYKQFVDTRREKLYWVFQYVGLKSNAERYFYEFEIYNGPVRKFKISEICFNDTTKDEDIFELEKCVVMSFASVRNFLNKNGELPFRFRIMKLRPYQQ